MSGLERLAELVERESGIRVQPSQYVSLRAALARAFPGTSAATLVDRAADAAAGPSVVQRLLDEVTVKETTFLRDRRQLETIPWQELSESAGARGSVLRMWSAGCATGEEPYTLAMLAWEQLTGAPPPVQIVATDISEAALEAARTGVYRSRAVRELGDAQIERFFRQEHGSYVVGPALRELVHFRRHNLVLDAAPPVGEVAFDLVLCRNVLIYFDQQTVEKVIKSLEAALRPGGTLIVGAADALCATATRLARDTHELEPEVTRPPPLRRPLGRMPQPTRDELLSAASVAAGSGENDVALAAASALLDADPLDADAYLLRGMIELETGQAREAVASLRRSLYVDPRFALAAFILGRACDVLGDTSGARRAYEQTLRTLDPEDDAHELLLQQIDVGDIAAACRSRLAAVPEAER